MKVKVKIALEKISCSTGRAALGKHDLAQVIGIPRPATLPTDPARARHTALPALTVKRAIAIEFRDYDVSVAAYLSCMTPRDQFAAIAMGLRARHRMRE